MGNGMSNLVQVFKQRDNPEKAMGREQIAEVVSFDSSPRQITISMLGVEISKNISIAQHLLSGYEREFDLNGTINDIDLTLTKNEMYTSAPVSAGTPQATVPYTPAGPVNLSLQGDLGALKGSGTYETTGTITWKTDSLIVGDFVRVLISEDEKRFFIIDRFESWS